MIKRSLLSIAGALLSHFIEPIYFNSIILGSLYHRDHMSRAMYARIQIPDILPPGYRFNRPLLSGTSSPESRQPGKAPNFSANWLICDEGLEVVTAMTGKTEAGTPSRLCKYEQFRKFDRLWGEVAAYTNQKVFAKPKLYTEGKASVMDYQIAKQHVYKAFDKAGLGTWIKKPVEQEQFELASS